MSGTKKTLLKLIQILFLLCLTIFFLHYGWITYNYTGLLNNPSSRIPALLLTLAGALALFPSLAYLLDKVQFSRRKPALYFFLILCILTVLFPYNTPGSPLSSLHLAFGLLCFLYFNRLLFELRYLSLYSTDLYLAFLILSCFFILTYQSITGLSEWIYAIGTGISLFLLLK